MIQQLSFVDVLAGVIDLLEKNINDIPVFDHFEKNQNRPFIHAEIVGLDPVPSKTMWKDKFQIYIHGWADGKQSSQPIFDVVDKIRSAMTEEIQLPEGYDLLLQKPEGTQRILDDEDKTKHAVMGYSLTITYGFKYKI